MSLKRPKGPAGPLLVLDHSSKILKGKSLRGITIDCGWRDQYHIHCGSHILSQRLAETGIRQPIRGIRRRPLRHRLPDGCQLAVSLQSAALMAGMKGHGKGSLPPAPLPVSTMSTAEHIPSTMVTMSTANFL